jgi:hypothetical protein
MTAVRDGGFHGWPYSYFGAHLDDRVTPARPDLADQAIVPDYALGAHTASLGITYAGQTSLPERFSNGMIVTQHGSWNRVPRSGYRVVFVPFANGKPAGQPTVLLTGFLDRDENAQGRPVGVAVDPRGGILVADDAGNTVWRVSGTHPHAVAAALPTLAERYPAAIRSAEAAVTGPAASNRRCVDANATENPESGDFAAGGFALYSATWHQGQGKLAFKPTTQLASPLVVTMTSLDRSEAPVEARIEQHSANGSYASVVTLPHPGDWMIVPRSGSAWGCFLYSLH